MLDFATAQDFDGHFVLCDLVIGELDLSERTGAERF